MQTDMATADLLMPSVKILHIKLEVMTRGHVNVGSSLVLTRNTLQKGCHVHYYNIGP